MSEQEPEPWDDPLPRDEPPSQARPGMPAAKPPRLGDEQLLVATVIADPAAWDALRHVRPSDFESHGLAIAWRGMRQLIMAGSPPTPMALGALDPTIDPDELAVLASRAPGSLPAAASAARRLSTARRAAAAASALRRAAQGIEAAAAGHGGADPEDWHHAMAAGIASAIEKGGSTRTVDSDDIDAMVIASLEEARPPAATGIARLDEFLGGGLPGSAVIAIAGPAKVGKTVLAATVSYNFERAAAPTPHLLVSLERTEVEIGRLKSARTLGIPASQLTSLSDGQRAALRQPRPGGRLCQVLHMPGASPEAIEAEVAYQRQASGIRAVIIDYLQLIGGRQRGEQEESHMSRVCQWLQEAASRQQVAILVTVMMDDMGSPWKRAGAIRHASQAFLVLNRDSGRDGAYLETQRSSTGNESDIGTITSPALTLERAGPHFR